MKLLKVIFVAIFVVAAAHLAAAAECGATVPEHPASDAHASADHGKHELTLHPVQIGRIVALALIAFAQVAMRNPKAIPDGKQNFWEWLVESLYKFIENIIGHQLATK